VEQVRAGSSGKIPVRLVAHRWAASAAGTWRLAIISSISKQKIKTRRCKGSAYFHTLQIYFSKKFIIGWKLGEKFFICPQILEDLPPDLADLEADFKDECGHN
jgi:hypothetical protein